MRFDDRLNTVLALEAHGAHDRAIQWRQLVELVARGAGRDSPQLRGRALQGIAALTREVPEDVRAAAARSIARASLPAELVALFAADTLEIAAPVLTAAELDPPGWAAVRAVASEPVAAMLAALRPEPAGVEDPSDGRVGSAETEQSALLPATVHSTNLAAGAWPGPTPRPDARPAVLPAGMFRWECGPNGEIDWVEGAPRAALIGCSVADELDRRFAARLPFEDERLHLTGEGALAGDWRWTGTPAFFADSGRFAGYRGTARREGAAADAPPTAPLDSDSLRELIHELRTPLNAIIGFGEMIDGQYLGPAHRVYRERAGTIVRQAKRLVEAVEDLDFAARLHSGRGGPGERVGFDVLFSGVRLALLEQAARADVTLTIIMRGRNDRLLVDRDIALRLLRRFLESVISAAIRGERLELVVDTIGEHVAVAVDRPDSVRGLSEDQLLDPAFGRTAGDELALGFALRLVRGLGSMVGGSLDIAPDRLILLLPATSG